MRRVHALFAFLAVTALSAAACNKIDTADAEKKIKAVAEASVGPVKSVSCPSAKRKKGEVFTCTVTFTEGTVGKLEITLVDDDGNHTDRWTPTIIGTERIAGEMETWVETNAPEAGEAKVDCGTGIKEVPAEGLTCSFTAGELKGDLLLTANDDGQLVWKQKE